MSILPSFAVILAWLTVAVSCDVLVSSETVREAIVVPNAHVTDKTCDIITKSDNSLTLTADTPTDIYAACKILLAHEQAGDTPAHGVNLGRQAVDSLFMGGRSFLHPIGWAVQLFGPLLPPTAAQSDAPPIGDPTQPLPKSGAKSTVSPSPVDSAPTDKPTAKPTDSRGPVGSAATASAEAKPTVAASPASSPAPEPRTDNGEKNDNEEVVAVFAATVVNMFSNAILPAMFGLLGTLAGIMRSVVSKVRDSTLNPRDVRLTWSLLPLGTIAGLTVGLIIAPDAATTSGAAGKVLSAASLSFLAGYGAENYFAMIDNLLTRVFPTTPPKP